MGFSFAKALKHTVGFKKDIQYFIDHHVDESLSNKKEAAALKAVDSLVRKSPIWSGPYIKSMRVGIGVIDSTHEPAINATSIDATGGITYPPKMPEAEAEMLRMIVKAELQTKIVSIGDKQLFTDIHITNSIPYAASVEYLGWEKTSAYHVFSKAAAELEILK